MAKYRIYRAGALMVYPNGPLCDPDYMAYTQDVCVVECENDREAECFCAAWERETELRANEVLEYEVLDDDL